MDGQIYWDKRESKSKRLKILGKVKTERTLALSKPRLSPFAPVALRESPKKTPPLMRRGVKEGIMKMPLPS
jgi:hypothetical protein